MFYQALGKKIKDYLVDQRELRSFWFGDTLFFAKTEPDEPYKVVRLQNVGVDSFELRVFQGQVGAGWTVGRVVRGTPLWDLVVDTLTVPVLNDGWYVFSGDTELVANNNRLVAVYVQPKGTSGHGKGLSAERYIYNPLWDRGGVLILNDNDVERPTLGNLAAMCLHHRMVRTGSGSRILGVTRSILYAEDVVGASFYLGPNRVTDHDVYQTLLSKYRRYVSLDKLKQTTVQEAI